MKRKSQKISIRIKVQRLVMLHILNLFFKKQLNTLKTL